MMQISKLIIYNKNGMMRQIEFKLGKLNIITGKSQSGKSAIGEIIEYCLGSKECNIAEGIIRETVAWYALVLQFNNFQVFVARQNPKEGYKVSTSYYYEAANTVDIPTLYNLKKNTTLQSVIKKLDGILQIEEINPVNANLLNIKEKPKTNLKSALKYCFQAQDEIAAKSFLFHNQAKPYVEESIKETMPYFLGAATKDMTVLMKRKKKLENKKRVIEATVNQNNILIGKENGRAKALVEEAQNIGLIDSKLNVNILSLEQLINILSSINLTDILYEYQGNEQLLKLKDQLKENQRQLNDYNSKIYETKKYIESFEDFDGENDHKLNRLKSINLYRSLNFTTNYCPFCSSKISSNVPDINKIKDAIETLDNKINQVGAEKPKLNAYLLKLEDEKEKINEKIKYLHLQIKEIYSQQKEIENIYDIELKQAIVVGKIRLWLDSFQYKKDTKDFSNRIDDIEKEIKKIESLVNQEVIDENMAYALSKIQTSMTKWAKSLDLEYIDSTYRYDPKKVTVIIDKDRPVALSQLGSGANWLGVHLIAYFAFQEYFINKNRPVPSFIFLDQPSQVYFPKTYKTIDKQSTDYDEVKNIYKFLNERVEEQHGKLQVIVVDHANLEEKIFQDHIIENWHNSDSNLVPLTWVKDSPNSKF